KELKRGEAEQLKKTIAEIGPSIGQLELKTNEPGAAIALDGKPLGSSPIAALVDAEAGRHVVTAKKTGAEPFAREVWVVGQQNLVVDLALEKEIVSGKVSIKEKSGQTLAVVLDNAEVGSTPWTSDVPLGSHEVMLRNKTMRTEA